MLQDFNNHIDANLSFLKEKKILIAISGGIDSVVLTHLLHKLNFNISLAHCNFQLRANESNLDEVFVKELAEKLLIKAFTIRFDTNEYSKINKLSTQVAARKLRYDYFDKLIEENQFDYVLTAHHADDNLETFLINLTRGTGLDGLTGIPIKNGNIVRPLLSFSRLVILKYANSNAITWREDKSNSEKKYIRNKIRHSIVPVLKEINPGLLKSFNKTSGYLQESNIVINDSVKTLKEEIITKEDEILKLNIEKILSLSNPKVYLYQFLKDYNFNEWDKVCDLLTAQSGKYLLTNSHMLLKNRDFLVISPILKSEKLLDSTCFIYENPKSIVDLPLKINIIDSKKRKLEGKKNILVDKKLVNYPLILRKWKNGDFFYPTGMFGKKKLSKFFKDEKLSLLEKKSVWLLCSNDDSIIWIIGLRQDRRFEVNISTKNILKISI